MAEIIEQQITPSGIYVRMSYTLDEVKQVADSMALFFLEQLELGNCEEIELPQWGMAQDMTSVSTKMMFKESCESAGLKLIDKDDKKFIVMDKHE